MWGALGSAGAAAGVLLGGVLTDTLGWESIFFINVPVGIGVGLAAHHAIAATPRRVPRRGELDLSGAVTLMAGLVGLVLAIEGTSTHGWTSLYTTGLAAAALALLVRLAALERCASRPLIPPATWRNRSLVTSGAVMFAATGILVGAFFLNTLFLQQVIGASPLETGLAFLPLTLVILAGAHAASHVLTHIGSRWTVVAGLALAAGGTALLSGAPVDPGYAADLLPGYLLLGFGLGMVFVSVSVAAMADVAHEHAGLASGLMTTAHELGAALGVAVLGSAGGFGTGLLVASGVAVALELGRDRGALRPAAAGDGPRDARMTGAELRDEARRDLGFLWPAFAIVAGLLVAIVQFGGWQALWPVWTTLGAPVLVMFLLAIWGSLLRGRR